MERLYSSQKTYIYSKSSALKFFLTISLFIALFQISELKAQNLVIRNTSSAYASSIEHNSYTIQFVITDFVATTNVEITDSILNLREILPLTTFFLPLDEGMVEKSIEGYTPINRIK